MSRVKIWPDEVLQPRLDEMLDDRPAVSPRTSIMVSGNEVEICFRVLSRQIIEYAKWEGMAHVMADMKANDIPIKNYIESAQGIDALNNENQIRLLHIAMIDPEPWEKNKSIQKPFTLSKLREAASPEELNNIDDKWVVWQTHKSIDYLTEEQIKDLKEQAKKKPPEISSLLRYGVGGLWIFTTILAAECETLQMSMLSLGGGGETPLTSLTPEETGESTDSPPWYTRLSASLDERIQESTRELQAEIVRLKETVRELQRGN